MVRRMILTPVTHDQYQKNCDFTPFLTVFLLKIFAVTPKNNVGHGGLWLDHSKVPINEHGRRAALSVFLPVDRHFDGRQRTRIDGVVAAWGGHMNGSVTCDRYPENC